MKGHVNECLILVVKDLSLGLIQMCEHKGRKKEKKETNKHTNKHVGMHSNKANRIYSLCDLVITFARSMFLGSQSKWPHSPIEEFVMVSNNQRLSSLPLVVVGCDVIIFLPRMF